VPTSYHSTWHYNYLCTVIWVKTIGDAISSHDVAHRIAAMIAAIDVVTVQISANYNNDKYVFMMSVIKISSPAKQRSCS